MSVSPDPVALTQTLVGFDTMNPPGDERQCAHYLGELLENSGFEVTYHAFGDGRSSVVARRGDQSNPVCFTGHIDTVPLGAQQWRFDPFAAEIHGDRLYGRGASDMKAGVAAFVAAAIDTAHQIDSGPGVVLVITAGEETGCEGAFHLTQTQGALGHAGAIVVAEPTSNYPLAGHKGALWLEASTTGETAHGSMPEHGDNAVYKAARMVTKLEQFDFETDPHPIVGAATLNVSIIEGGMNINSVPDSCKISIDIRTIPGMKHDQLRDRLIHYLAPDLGELRVLVDLEGVWTEPAENWMQRVYALAESVIGEHPEGRSATYFTDASVLTGFYGAPTVVLGPGEAAMAHQTDEYCHVSRISEAHALYKSIIQDWVGA